MALTKKQIQQLEDRLLQEGFEAEIDEIACTIHEKAEDAVERVLKELHPGVDVFEEFADADKKNSALSAFKEGFWAATHCEDTAAVHARLRVAKRMMDSLVVPTEEGLSIVRRILTLPPELASLSGPVNDRCNEKIEELYKLFFEPKQKGDTE